MGIITRIEHFKQGCQRSRFDREPRPVNTYHALPEPHVQKQIYNWRRHKRRTLTAHRQTRDGISPLHQGAGGETFGYRGYGDTLS